jgi:hypothetical protein
MADIGRFSKSLQNYQLDQTELQDNDQNARVRYRIRLPTL